jgi:hypothetical protein
VNAADLRERLASLREAGRTLRERPARKTLDALAQLLDAWRDPASAWRRALEAELPAATGFSPEVVREGLARGLAGWSGDALRALVLAELGGEAALEGAGRIAVCGFDATSVILAGSIPMPTLLALVAPLALRSPVLAKAAARDLVTPRLVLRSLEAVDAELARALAVVTLPGHDPELVAALLEAECVALVGSDASVEALRARARGARRIVARGHRLSLAALGLRASRGRALREAAAGLAQDIALWDQLGCLSPVSVHVVGPDREAPDRVAEAMAEAMAAAETRWPRGRVDPATAAAIADARDTAELRGAGGRRVAVLASSGTAWTVVREDGAELRPSPLHRFVRVHPAESGERLRAALAPVSRHLAAVAVAGFGPETAGVARALAALGASRVCAPGTCQSPPLAWHHDGEGVLAPFARVSDLEVAG